MPELKFAVLGLVRAWRGEAELSLGAPQQRAVLAMLLLAAGRQVTLNALIHGLWEDEPPLAATGTVRTYVSRLRRGLRMAGGDSAAGAIESAGTGYFIPARAGTLDLDVFQQMVADAQALKSRGLAGKAQAASLLRDALRLGQGEPLADIPGPYARYQRARITELRLAMTEERLALEIELGAHVVSVAELHALLAEYPMRERISELLMLALYRSGRRVDALTVFDSTRRLLVGEFGVEPGPSLREMHQRILQTDEGFIRTPPRQPPQKSVGPARGGPLATPSRPMSPAPAQLPADLPVFAGRSRELARLDALAGDGTRCAALTVVAVDGMAGMGKTALAVHWAYQVADRFPDGQLYANLRGFDPDGPAMSAGDALRGFLEALGVVPDHIPDDLDAQASLYRSILRGRRILVLLDNAHDMPQVRPLLPASPGCLVIVTSRNRLLGLITAHGASSVTLQALSAEEARHRLRRSSAERYRRRAARRCHPAGRPEHRRPGGRRAHRVLLVVSAADRACPALVPAAVTALWPRYLAQRGGQPGRAAQDRGGAAPWRADQRQAAHRASPRPADLARPHVYLRGGTLRRARQSRRPGRRARAATRHSITSSYHAGRSE